MEQATSYPNLKTPWVRNGFQRATVAAKRQLDIYFHATMVLVLNIPFIFLFLILNLKGVQPDTLVLFYVPAVILGYYVFALQLVLTILSILLVFSGRFVLLVNGLVLTLVGYYLLLDHLVYGIFRLHVDLFWLDYIIHDFRDLGLSASLIAIAVATLIGFASLEWGLLRLARHIPMRKSFLLGLTLVGLIAFGSSQAIHIAAYEKNISCITRLTPHFPFYVPFISHRYAARYDILLSTWEDEFEIGADDHRNSSLEYPLRTIRSNLPDGVRPLNIVFLLLESWRADAMNESVTPNIYSLSKKSSVFHNHFSSGNSTTAGIFGLFYGIHPTYWMAVKSNNAALHNPLLIDLMQDSNYSFGVYADSHFKRHKIKDSMFRDIEVHETFSGSSHDEKDEDMKNRVLSFIRRQRAGSQPFMLFAFFKSSHYDYQYPVAFRKFTPAKEMNMSIVNRRGKRDAYLNDYRNAVYYNDALIGEILAELESSGMMDNTVIVITTDHGEEFDDNGANYWGHGSNFTRYQTHVPLVLYCPGKEPAVSEELTTHVDIPVTLIQEVFGVQNDVTDYSNGKNLLNGVDGDRPLVIGSYVNHAFMIDDNVYVIFPLYTREYKLENINEDADGLRLDLMRVVVEEVTRFYLEPNDF